MTPDVFTAEQRRRLLACWKRDRDRARTYLAAVEPRIGAWLGLRPATPNPTDAQIRDACAAFADQLAELQRFTDQHREHLYALIGHTEDSAAEAHVRLALQHLREAAPVLRTAALAVTREIAVERGPDRSHERLLVAWLAILYRRCFNREPSIAADSVFDRFLRELAVILDCQFGPAARAGIRDHGALIPPATGWKTGTNKRL
jgi:hypothetical protein